MKRVVGIDSMTIKSNEVLVNGIAGSDEGRELPDERSALLFKLR